MRAYGQEAGSSLFRSVRDAVCEAAGAMRRTRCRRIACALSVGCRSAAFEAKECKHQTVLH
ncbi:hypothetical protein DIE04_21480 [Burkholderia sp. Bp8994]|nr:hypothetical protein DIE20_22355 [Burkholderia sp. Bp9131]RQR69220.1 hypothetical protein DIE12_24050 [Burkholderia sp. Bp9015]RQR93488.1 hypothetical protein DIE04_21480 [Burkholderia sp. Bp8994]RQS27110.1 hypothetical protein DIE05_19295 [Burkholderia sp. Bp8995]RQS37724.1 hypothetical protein DIE01_21615 [Burkholderia sp. Bp8990]RQS45484.1 hypothetical protein DIE00_19115 [Burkholderia sp. Bp8989]RQZ44122.1 hypothetical protein DIE17_25270 [Burkholderia sp. Bp9099]